MSFNETLLGNGNEYNLLQTILMVTIFASISVLGVIGNIIVLAIAIRKQNCRSVTNCYIINLAITDLLFLIISVPFTTYLGLSNTWILSGIISCRIHISIAHVLLQATCYTLAFMSIDRCLYIISGRPRPRWRTPFIASIICILIWIVSTVFVFSYTRLISSSETEKKSITDCPVSTSHPLFGSCLFPFLAYYILPLMIIGFCYTRLCFYMRRVSLSVTRNRINSNTRPRTQLKRRSVTRTLLSLTFAFAICWLPIHILELLNCQQMLDKFYDKNTRLLDSIRVLAHALSYFNSCLNPILYALYNRHFFI